MTDSIRSIFAKNLRDLRKSQGLTQEDLAKKAGYLPSAYNRWETGKNWPEEETISRIAKALGVQESTLFFDETLISPKVASKIIADYFNPK